MIWGQGDGCWEHCNPLARYAMMADGEPTHSAMYPGSIFTNLFSEHTEVNIRQHALESACFVVCATAWLGPDQRAQVMTDTGCSIGPIRRLLHRDDMEVEGCAAYLNHVEDVQ